MSNATASSDIERAEHLPYAGSAGVKRVSIYNNGSQINAATEEKQDEIITTQEDLILAVESLPNNNFSVLIKNSIGSIINPATQDDQQGLKSVIDEAEIFRLYHLHNIDNDSNITLYSGRVKNNGTWLLIKFNLSTMTKSFANAGNNSGITNYTGAWSQRNLLIYDYLYNLVSL